MAFLSSTYGFQILPQQFAQGFDWKPAWSSQHPTLFQYSSFLFCLKPSDQLKKFMITHWLHYLVYLCVVFGDANHILSCLQVHVCWYLFHKSLNLVKLCWMPWHVHLWNRHLESTHIVHLPPSFGQHSNPERFEHELFPLKFNATIFKYKIHSIEVDLYYVK